MRETNNYFKVVCPRGDFWFFFDDRRGHDTERMLADALSLAVLTKGRVCVWRATMHAPAVDVVGHPRTLPAKKAPVQ